MTKDRYVPTGSFGAILQQPLASDSPFVPERSNARNRVLQDGIFVEGSPTIGTR